jgi:SAM-dependent methyltransferase
MLRKETAEEIAAAYPELEGFERFHLLKRLGWCPYDEIAAELPRQGTHVEIGCGFGHFLVYLALAFPDLKLAGCDPDARKIAVARTSRPAREGRIELVEGGFRVLKEPFGNPDAVSIIDVLYLMKDDEQRRLLAWAAETLAPGGRIVIKTLDTEQGLQSRLAELQEFVMVRILRRTASSGAWKGAKPASAYVKMLERFGLKATARRLAGTRTPSVLIVASKA